MQLRKVVLKDYDEGLNQANAMHAWYFYRMMAIVKRARINALTLVSGHLGFMHDLNIMDYRRTRMDARIDAELKLIFEMAAEQVTQVWEEARNNMALHGRLLIGFVARKYSPPWIPTQLDLESKSGDTKDGDSWKSAPYYHLKNLANTISQQITLGLMQTETLHQILTRVRGVLGNADLYKGKEADEWDYERIRTENKKSQQYSWENTEEIFDRPPVDLSEGTFTLEDVERYRSQQVKAMGFQNRSVGSTRELTKVNKAFMALERDFMTDMVEMLHLNMLPVGTENMGIEDFVWIVSKPQKECDACTDRDGLTMKQIKSKKFKDDLGSSPPPAHWNCRCQLVPQLREDWAKDETAKNGYEWDENKGLTYVPNEQEKKLGFETMDWDEWIDNIQSERSY